MNIIKANHSSEIPKNFTGVVEFPSGTKYWLKEGKRHREDGPAVEWTDGTKEWYKEGKRHREDGPAVEYADGTKEWYKEGKRHREDGPSAEHADGSKNWYLEGKWYGKINLKKYIVLDYCKGEYGIMWYKLLGKDNVFEYPDISGLIEK